MNNRRGSFRDKMVRFMYGRYGQMDNLNKFLLGLWFVLYFVGVIVSRFNSTVGSVISCLTPIIFILYIFRIMSRNVYKRSAENMKYLEIRNKFLSIFNKNKYGNSSYSNPYGNSYGYSDQSYKKGATTAKVRPVRDPAYRYFKCSKCKKTVRVPKNHGKVELTCKNCGHTFVRYTGKRK